MELPGSKSKGKISYKELVLCDRQQYTPKSVRQFAMEEIAIALARAEVQNTDGEVLTSSEQQNGLRVIRHKRQHTRGEGSRRQHFTQRCQALRASRNRTVGHGTTQEITRGGGGWGCVSISIERECEKGRTE